MAFNWFRRQYNDSSSTPPQQQPEETPAAKEESNQPAATSTSTEVASQDLLAFAKAAYKNIQQKQQSDQQETIPSTETTQPVEQTAEAQEPETETTQPVEQTAEAQEPETETPQPVEQTAEVEQPTTETPQPVELTVEAEEPESLEEENPTEVVAITEQTEGESVAESDNEVESPNETVLSTTEEVNEEAIPKATLSFLERAAAERQARQERLVASAIELPQPEVSPSIVASASTTTSEEIVEIPELAFDEGFLWSTEILAAQGRRPEDVSVEEITWLKKLRQGLDKTRRNILNQLKAIVGQGPLNQAAVEEIEALLLQADVGVEATDYIIKTLQQKLREDVLPPEAAIAYLKQILQDMLDAPVQKSQKPIFAPEKETLNIWLITGVNGAGKTTTIGKIAHLAQKSGYKSLIGAADTFRAAAVEQVKVWGQRSGVEVIANPGKNTDPAAVVFDAISAALSRETELLLVDTAGRLQNKKNLMDELSKIRRIIDKKAPHAKVESLLVLDSTLGQNGLRQAEVFSEAAGLSGVILTKLDSTAKGGIALAVVKQLGLPIRFIGAGEGIEDLRPFSSYEFVEALLSG
ncbi:signal recognition particle-docking protein FtsY [Aetokthonos hydrillicola Thurmond2011]|jgi:fused signal recognition particle receptor|uniref:Signal recognition particle receptor FtsY n=1 Tax=Aetokthonos hydrillicola Thurmond2011 TaxID=2712845 RepID=A0AAP5I5X2_9CYAN|nr:signal recognition particle-docking protein FtsY [Aetokthonos hydrillicola]MBO3459056.1 signal recognition particle-docking protein FtsY [Aetokthonos hydrillicola CCALA 1050]MBW4584772.1 signal recognition particle-docking protein FtsY [Aetokthonos hydrillicola CCALA 1050]MDR9895319.1 signal recognition particle-docking protein FtsY [Aetokthonos hydrillicola Thurmond2011]